MEYNRRDFLKVAAAGLSVVGGGWLFSGAALAREPDNAYSQEQADRIHARSMEQAIRQAGEDPEEIKARVNREMDALREDMNRSGEELRENINRSVRAL